MEDVVAPTFLPVFGEVKIINLFGNSGKIILNKEDNQKLEALNALSESKSSNKSTHASWVRHFSIGMGTGSGIEFEAMLLYWLLWYVFPSRPEDGLNPYLFPLALVGHRSKIYHFSANWMNASGTL